MKDPIHPITIPIRTGLTLYVGPNPWNRKEENPHQIVDWLETRFDAIVKVSDCASHLHAPPLQIPTYWIPFSEINPWPFVSLYAFKHTMDKFLQGKDPTNIYLHCEAGVSRSQALAFLWLESLTPRAGGPLTFTPGFISGAVEAIALEEKAIIPPGTKEFFREINHYPKAECNTILLQTRLFQSHLENPQGHGQ